jgi:hypothetical protein
MEGGMVGIGIGFDGSTEIGIVSAVDVMAKALVITDTDSGIEELERHQVPASLCNLMKLYG